MFHFTNNRHACLHKEEAAIAIAIPRFYRSPEYASARGFVSFTLTLQLGLK